MRELEGKRKPDYDRSERRIGVTAVARARPGTGDHRQQAQVSDGSAKKAQITPDVRASPPRPSASATAL
jgi:hypothetical protein